MFHPLIELLPQAHSPRRRRPILAGWTLPSCRRWGSQLQGLLLLLATLVLFWSSSIGCSIFLLWGLLERDPLRMRTVGSLFLPRSLPLVYRRRGSVPLVASAANFLADLSTLVKLLLQLQGSQLRLRGFVQLCSGAQRGLSRNQFLMPCHRPVSVG